MIRSIILLFVLLPVVTGWTQFSYDISKIKRQAEKINQKQYDAWVEKENAITKNYEDIYLGDGPKPHVYKRHPSYQLNVPLAYYYLRLKENGKKQICCFGYLEAICYSPETDLRQQLIFYLMAPEGRPPALKSSNYDGWFYRYISESATPDWVNAYLTDSLSDLSDTNPLFTNLINDWAEELSPQNARKAYNYTRKNYPGTPGYSFDILFRLMPERAQNETWAYWQQKHPTDSRISYDYNVVIQLYDHAHLSENPLLAKRIRVACFQLENDPKMKHKRQTYLPRFNTILLYLDPNNEVPVLIDRLNNTLNGTARIDTIYAGFHHKLTHAIDRFLPAKTHYDLLETCAFSPGNLTDGFRVLCSKQCYEHRRHYFIKQLKAQENNLPADDAVRRYWKDELNATN